MLARMKALAVATAALIAAAPAHALDFKPKLEAEGRWFFEADGQPVLGSASATLEIYQDLGEGKQRIVGEFFGRWDENDDARTHADVRELYYHAIGDDFEFRLGSRRVFWGVTESRHLVDVINQSDFVENVDSEDKLGQPMMNLALIRPFGTVDLFLLPYARARTFPGADGHPRLPYPVAADEARYEADPEQWNLDYAVRYVNAFGPLDLGVSWFDGNAREPRLVGCVRRGADSPTVSNPGAPNCEFPYTASFRQPPLTIPPQTPEQVAAQFAAEVQQNIVLVPHYDLLRQASVDAQYVFGNTALKVEALRRHQLDEWTWAAVSGFEYTFGDVGGSGADVGVLAEYLFDEKDDGLGVLADDDVFVGSRLALNDVAGTTALAGVVGTRKEFGSRLYLVEVSRRLTDEWRLAGEARLFEDMPAGSLEAFLEDQDFLTVTLERFF